ncbi:MAG: ATP-binding protein [Myxococcota bacterium]
MTDAPVLPGGAWIAINSLTIAFYAGFAVFVYLRRPAAPLWPVLFWTQIAALLWASGDLAAYLSPDLVAKSSALVVLYSGSLPLAGLWFLMGVRFAEANGAPFSWGRSRWVYAPLALAGVAWIAFLTNPWHGQFVTLRLGGPQDHHWMWWAASSLNQIVGLSTAGLYISIARRTDLPAKLREQADILLAATIAVPLANLLNSLCPGIWPVDLTVASGSLVGGLYLYGIYRTNLFDLSPIALEQIVRDDPSGVLLADRGLRLRFANDAAGRLLPGLDLSPGVAIPELLSGHLTRYRDPATRMSWTSEWRDELGSGRGCLYQFESEGPGTSGRTSWLWITATLLPRAAGLAAPHCLRIQDVTELAEMTLQRRELSLRLERAERLESLGVLAGGVARELAAPLRAVRGGAERAVSLVGDEVGADARIVPTAELRDALVEVARESRRGHEIATQMMRFAREAESSHSTLDLNRAVCRACARARDMLERRGALLELELTESSVPVRGHATEIEQMVVNLLHNAAESAGRGGRIRVTTEVGESESRLGVSDDGPGMEDDVRRRALEPFFTTHGEDGASGLGLSVVHGIATAHAGRVEIHSGPGLGCRVEVCLPLSQAIPVWPGSRPDAGDALRR